MAMTLPTAEELFRETVRKVSSTPQEWLKFLNTASRVYQYTFDAQLMIYAQRPNAIGCTSFEKWKQMNHYVKRGTQGIALIVRNGENRKLRYVYDYSDTGVASNIPETDIRKPYIWSLGEDGQEDLCDYINNKYNIRPQNKDLGLVLKQLIEETVNDVIDDEISEILKEKQGSYLEDLDIDTIRKEYRELFIHSAWYMLLRRCGVEPGDYMYLEDFRAITDFNNINVISCLGTPVSEQCSFVLKDISRYLWQKNLQKNRAESIVQSNQREYNKDNKTQEQKRGVNRNDVDIHKEGGRTAVSGSGIKGSSEGIHREIRSNESRLSGAASEIKVYGDDDDRGNQSTYDRHSETGRGENGRTDARTDEDSRSNRGTEGSRSDEVGRTRKQLQTAGGGDNQRRDYIQLSLFPENPQEQAEYGTAAGNTPAAVFAFPDNYIDECLRTGGNNELSLEYVLLDLAQENPQKILAKDLKENWKGGKGLAMPDGIKVSVWYNEEGISFRRGNGARKNPERLLSWEEAAERIEILYRNGQFTTRELSENAISTIREETAGLIAFFYKEDMGQSRWGNIHSEAVISIIEELKATAGIKKLYDEISLFGTARAGSISQWQEKRCENLAERLYKLGNLSPLVPQNVQEIAPMVFITADEIDRLLQEGGIVEGGKRRILSFYQQEPAPDTKTAINFLKQEYGMGGHSHSISESRNSNEWHDAKGFHLEKGNVQKKLTWKEAEKRIRTLIENKEYPYIHQEAKTETRENVPNFGTQEEKKADTIQFQIDFSEHDILSHYDKEKKAYVTAKMSFAAANRLFAELDEQEMEQQENEGEGYSYYKTAFSIYAIINGEEYSFQGRYDIGSEGKSLIEHIQEYYDYCLSPDCMYRQYWEEDGVLEEKIEQLTKYNENFLPYLESHLDLTPAERKQITALIHKEEPEVLQDKKYEIMDTGRIDFPFDVQEWTRENNEFVFSGCNKYCKSREEASAWIEEQQKESNLIEVAVESSEDYEDIAGSFVTAVDTEGNRQPVYRLIQKGNDGLETYLPETILFYSEKEAKNYIKSHADEIREISYDEMINWAAEIREDRIAATELQEEILDTDNIAITPVSNDRGQNYHIPKEELGTGTTREKCWKNILAIETVKQLDQEQRKATREEQDILADYVVTFEELGVDRLFVDESHGFKNLFLYTKMRNVAGVAQSESQKSMDMYNKCRYMDEITGGKGITFATGTPVSNSMTELYTIQRYLQYDRLQEMELGMFDNWASAFGETVTALELSPEGSGYRMKTRFANFFNLPELMSVFQEVADIQTADMLRLPVPEAEYENIVLPASEEQKEILESLSERADRVRNREVDPSEDNMLKITTDGRKLALDQRLINDMLPDTENNKVSACAEKCFEIWKETKEQRSAQLIFCDSSTPKKDGTFNVYDALKEKLMQKGVPEQEIAFIHDANTDVQKAKLFTKVRSGQVRFLLGSTSKMGAGTNVQDKLIALHHLDVPWRPADIEQQEGRILRQGNQNEKVKIFRYITENTFDAYSWQLIENKQKFIGQIMTSKSPVRSCQDVDEAALSYAEVKALATGNPKIKEKMDLDIQVTKLKMLKANYESNLFRLQDAIAVEYPQQIAKYEELTAAYEADIAHLDTAMNTPFSMEIHGITYDNEKTAGEILVQACTKMKKEHTDAADIGTFKGFKMKVSYSLFDNSFYVKLTRESSVTVEVKKDPVRNIERILTALRKMPGQKDVAEERLEGARQQLVQAKEEVNKPFEKENELRSVQERLTKINAELDMKPKEEPKKMIKKEELKKCL